MLLLPMVHGADVLVHAGTITPNLLCTKWQALQWASCLGRLHRVLVILATLHLHCLLCNVAKALYAQCCAAGRMQHEKPRAWSEHSLPCVGTVTAHATYPA